MMRDLIGYGKNPPDRRWPNQAFLAINFVINYEEGAELTPVNRDATAETYGAEFMLPAKPRGIRNLSMESLFEYGSRCGIWRLLRLFDAHHIPLTFFITGLALTLNPEFTTYLKQSQHEVAGHGWRWIDYSGLSVEEEKSHIDHCLSVLKGMTDKKVEGWYTGRRSENTLLLLKQKELVYLSDSYADDLPYFDEQQLIIPYTLDCNDFRYTTNPGFNQADDFYIHLKNSFDYLYQERRTALMTIALHPRISGRPGRAVALEKFLHYLKNFPDVWIARRVDIGKFWLKSGVVTKKPHK